MGSGHKPKYYLRTVILTLGLLLLPILPFNFSNSFFDLVGRWHPLVVHFPIVLIMTTAIFEWLQGHSQSHHLQRIFSNLYTLCAASSILAVAVGFFLLKNGDYEGAYIDRHLWSAIVLTIILLWSRKFRKLYQENKKWRFRQIYRTLIFIAFFGVIYTSHLGGSMTHGPDFLTEPLQDLFHQRQLSQTTAHQSPQSLGIYHEIVQPILKSKCIKCHNQAKTKGGLDMSSWAKMLQGGKSTKPGLVAGDVDQSEIMVRVSLPSHHDDFMPPDGKNPLSREELQIISWWIASGASSKDTLGSLEPDSITQSALDFYLPTIAATQLAQTQNNVLRSKLSPKLIRLGAKNGFKIQSDPRFDSVYYTVSMQIPPQSVGDAEISALLPYRHLFSKVSLVGADISEEGLYYLSQMPNVREIILVKCCVKGEGLVHLSTLKKLTLLNLSYTDVTNENAMQLTAFPALKEVYLFNSFVDPKVVGLIDHYLSGTKVCLEEGPYY